MDIFLFFSFCILQLIILYSHSCYHHALFHYRVRCHIVHLSTAKALPIIIEARKAGAPLTVETCHHYLSLEAETIPDGATQYKCCPPIRGKSNQVRTFLLMDDKFKFKFKYFFESQGPSSIPKFNTVIHTFIPIFLTPLALIILIGQILHEVVDIGSL